MKKSLFASYVGGIYDVSHGERYKTILRYFYPEFITALLLYSLPIIIDLYFVSCLKSTACYASSGTTNLVLNLVTKTAESCSVAMLILVGMHNGANEKEKVGVAFKHAFWTTLIIGGVISAILYFGAPLIYLFLKVPADMFGHCVGFLRMRALGILFVFIYMACFGFLRGVKNTRVPMFIFALGVVIFLLADYCLIFGLGPIPPLHLDGSAIASILQFASMSAMALSYLFFGPYRKEYRLVLFSGTYQFRYLRDMIRLVLPIFLDKWLIAFSYIWLNRAFGLMGTEVSAAFVTIRTLEQVAFLPAVAFAQVITLLVSNDFGARNWGAVKSNIKKVIFMGSGMVFAILLVLSLFIFRIVGWFDQKGDFTYFAAHVFPIISVLVLFDLLQLILAAALRGAANVKMVMMVRLVVIGAYFIPVSYFLSHLRFEPDIKFILLYSSFFVGSALMGLWYLYQFRNDKWKVDAEVSHD